jgi:hypothetical protein
MMLHEALARKTAQAANQQVHREADEEDGVADDQVHAEHAEEDDVAVPDAAPVVTKANKNEDAHRLLFVLLGQVIQLLCVRRLTRESLNIADKTLLAYNILFNQCFPHSSVFNQHFNGSHLKGSIYIFCCECKMKKGRIDLDLQCCA